MSEVETLRVFEGAVGVEGVEPHEVLMSLCSLHANTCMSYDSLGDVQLGFQRVHLTLDIEDASVGLMESAQLSKQSPVVDLLGRFHNLMVGRGVPLYILEEPGGEWLGGLIHRVAAGGVQVEDVNWVAQASHGSQHAWNGGVEEFDIALLALFSISSGDVEVGEPPVVLLIPFRALVLLLLRLLGSELGEFATKLAHFGHGVIVLVGTAESSIAEADGDRAEGGWVEGVWGVKYVEGALRRQGEELFVEGLAVWRDGDSSNFSILEVGDDCDGGPWEGDRKGGSLGCLVDMLRE